jgi:hypothetical protein
MLTLPTHTVAPATEHALTTLKGIIYAIVNSYDGKTYIGKSTKTFRKRYGPKWWNSTVNVLLLRTLDGYAKPEDFSIYILEAGIENGSINEREKYYASLLNTYCPDGYNIRECGEEGQYHGEEFVRKVKRVQESMRKTYQVRHIATNELVTITYLKEWCKDKGLREMAFRNLLCGIAKTSQGYCLPETTSDQLRDMRTARGVSYTVKHIASGRLISFSNAVQFCEDRNIGYPGFKSMLTGQTKTSFGYCLPQTILSAPVSYQITSPTGEIVRFSKIRDFEKLHKIGLRGLREGKCCRHGWTNLIEIPEATEAHAPDSKPHSTQAGPSQGST